MSENGTRLYDPHPPANVRCTYPLDRTLPVGGAADRVGLIRHQRLHEHRTELVGLGTLEVLGHERRQVNRVGVLVQDATLTRGPSYTTFLDPTSPGLGRNRTSPQTPYR
jgi:hypothetical protein